MDPLSTIASVAGLLQAISAACVTINTISNLPKAFDHVKKHLPLVRKTLEEMRNRIERRKLTEEEECTIVGILDDCAAKTQRLKQIFDALEMRCKRETHIRSWDKLRVWYIEALRGIKGHRVESLMNDILDDIKRLSLYETFWLATQEDVSEITKALEEISHTEPSLNDAAVEYTSVAYATQYVNTGGMGQQNNPSGGSNTFNSGYNISGGTVVIGKDS